MQQPSNQKWVSTPLLSVFGASKPKAQRHYFRENVIRSSSNCLPAGAQGRSDEISASAVSTDHEKAGLLNVQRQPVLFLTRRMGAFNTPLSWLIPLFSLPPFGLWPNGKFAYLSCELGGDGREFNSERGEST